MSVLHHSLSPTVRRQRYREYMKAFSTTAARDAIDRGLVLSDLHGDVPKLIASRAEIEPDSQQAIVGGIGSGKTTVLLMAADELKRKGLTPLYVDVSSFTGMPPQPGALLAIAGLELLRTLPGERASGVESVATMVNEFAHGKWIYESKLVALLKKPISGNLAEGLLGGERLFKPGRLNSGLRLIRRWNRSQVPSNWCGLNLPTRC